VSTLNKINLTIIACILVSLYYWFSGQGDTITEYFAFSTTNLLAGRVWTLVTALFLHADPLHLAGNMIFLYAFGNALEKEAGAGKTYLSFFVGGLLTFVLGVPFYGGKVFIVGASAAIFTLTAIVMLVKPLKFSLIFLMPLGLVAVIYIIYNLIAVQSGFEGNIAYMSHVIGFAIGIPFGMAWSKDLKKNLLITLGLLLIYLVVAFVLLPLLVQSLSLQTNLQILSRIIMH
jgi:membrane associated rhomboid family serine protease